MNRKKTRLWSLLGLFLATALVFFFLESAERARQELRKRGVLTYERGAAMPGVNIFHDLKRHVFLMSNEGELLYEWEIPFKAKGMLHHAEIAPDNDLVGMYQGSFLFKISPRGELRWRKKIKPHHDFDFLDENTIVSFSEYQEELNSQGETFPIRVDKLVLLDLDGNKLAEKPFYSLLQHLVTPEVARRSLRRHRKNLSRDDDRGADVFHANRLLVLDKDHPVLGRKGNVIALLRNINTLVSIDLEQERLHWSLKVPDIQLAHEPHVLPNGDILLFDNGRFRGWSRIIILDPEDGEVKWEYKTENPANFFSRTQGGVQPLPNGNFLVSEANRGRIFELTPDKKIVWEYLHVRKYPRKRDPKKVKADKEKNKKFLKGRTNPVSKEINRMMRYPLSWYQEHGYLAEKAE